MSYGFIQDVPVNEHVYEKIKAGIGAERPKGLISHVAIKREGGLRYIDVWETKADWDRFLHERVEPAVGAVLSSMGIPQDRSRVHVEDVEVVDSWV